MTDTTPATTVTPVHPVTARAKALGLHLLDVWSHAPMLAGAVYRWVRNPEAWADLKAEKLRPSAYQREAEVLTKGMYGRIIIVAAAAVVVGIIAANLLTAAGPLWWPLLLAMAYGAGWLALRLPKATQGAAGDAAEDYTGERAGIRKMLAAKLAKVSRPETITVSELKEVYDGEAGSIGRRFTIGLPSVATVDDVEKLRANIAGELETKTDRIDITEGTSPRQAIVFVADRSPSEIPPARWPLETATSFDLAKKLIPIGVTLDGKPAGLQLFSKDARGDLQGFHLLLTGMSRYGKSTLLQTILAACALDDRAVLDVTVLGQDTRDFEDIEPALTHLTIDATAEDLNAQMDRAMAHMKAKTGKPYVVVIDEAQFQLGATGDTPARGKLRELLSSGGKAGIAIIVVTQEPTKENLHPDLARRPQNRISFRQSQNETAQRAMGSGMTDDTDPSLFVGGDQGLAAVIGEDGLHGRVKTPLLPAAVVARIATAHPREKLHTTQGTAGAPFPAYGDHPQGTAPHGAQEAAQRRTIDLDEVRALWPHPRPTLTTAELADLLPGGWEPVALAGAFQAAGLTPRQVSINGNRPTFAIDWADLAPAEAADTILARLAAVWPTTDGGQPAPNAFLDHLLTLLQSDPTTGTYDGWGRPELRKAARAEGLEPREKVRVGDRLSPGFTYPDLIAAMGGSEATRTTRTP